MGNKIGSYQSSSGLACDYPKEEKSNFDHFYLSIEAAGSSRQQKAFQRRIPLILCVNNSEKATMDSKLDYFDTMTEITCLK